MTRSQIDEILPRETLVPLWERWKVQDVDLEEVWKTSNRDVPLLVAGVERLLGQS